MFPSSGAPTQTPPPPSSVNTSPLSGSSSRQLAYVVIASAPSSHVQLLRQSRHAADGGELLPAVQPPQSSPVLRRPIHTGVFPLWRRSHHTVSNASNYIKSPFYSNAHCAVRILLFTIDNTLDLIIRTGADPHSVRTLCDKKKLNSVQCNFPRAEIFLTAIKRLLGTLTERHWYLY